MQVWRGWTAMASTPTIRALTWDEWCARQQCTARDEQCRQPGVPFSEQQLARLSFLRWLYHTGRHGLGEHDSECT
jgi:hypothetical protein